MSDQLPPLPVPAVDGRETGEQDSYTADQMHAYARAAQAMAYERAAQECEKERGTVNEFAPQRTFNAACDKCAANIRALAREAK